MVSACDSVRRLYSREISSVDGPRCKQVFQVRFARDDVAFNDAETLVRYVGRAKDGEEGV